MPLELLNCCTLLGSRTVIWLLDTRGYGLALGTINFLGVLASLFEAMPSLGFQASPRLQAWSCHKGRLAEACARHTCLSAGLSPAQLRARCRQLAGMSRLWLACCCSACTTSKLPLQEFRNRVGLSSCTLC